MAKINEVGEPKFDILAAFKSPLNWLIALAVEIVIYFCSEIEVDWVVGVLAVIAIILLVIVVYTILYFYHLISHLLKVRKAYKQLQLVVGEKESRIVALEREMESHPSKLFRSFLVGTVKGISAAENRIADNRDVDIKILEKRINDKSLELIFDAGKNLGITEQTLLSILTSYSDDLWGVVRIVEVRDKISKGVVISRTKEKFWEKLYKDAQSDASPPENMKAKLYSENNLLQEIQMIDNNLSEKGEQLHNWG